MARGVRGLTEVAESGADPRSGARLVRGAWIALAVVGGVIAVDGALRGEPRHRVTATLFGLALFVPAALALFSRNRRVGRALERLALAALTTIVCLAGLEAVVRFFDLPAFSATELRSDPVLGHAHVPRRGGLDAWGFRNARVPAGDVDVVCVGDSQTFGNNLPREASYPSRLAARTGATVYNMSLGGYGPLQYLALTERALQLAPRQLVVGLYLGNDLVDAFRFAQLEHWSDFRTADLAYPPLLELEHGDDRSLNLGMAVIDGLLARSRVLRSVGERVKQAVKLRRYGRGLAADESAGDVAHLAPSIGTVLTPRFRTGLVDLDAPVVAAGLANTTECFRRIAARCADRGTTARVLLLRNKEAYYALLLEQRGVEPSPELARLLAEERVLLDELRAAARAAGLDWIDPTEALVAALDRGEALFPADEDAHFGPAGTEVLAAEIARALGLGTEGS